MLRLPGHGGALFPSGEEPAPWSTGNRSWETLGIDDATATLRAHGSTPHRRARHEAAPLPDVVSIDVLLDEMNGVEATAARLAAQTMVRAHRADIGNGAIS